MIEMRWLEFESTISPETGESFHYTSKYKKLQYRYVIGKNFDPNPILIWTAWTDVSTTDLPTP